MTKPTQSCVWFEIPVSDLDKGMKFYGNVTGIPLNRVETPANPIADFDIEDAGKMPSGHLYPGKPATDGTGPTIHLASVDGLDAGLRRVPENGGTVLSPIIEIPAGRFVYCQDPDGNSFGLFEAR